MKKKMLYMVKSDGDDGEYLRMSSGFKDFDQSRPATDADLTLEAIVDLLDGDAESSNAHDFVTTHRALAALLIQEIGRDAATKFFLRLVDFGGLHGLTGIGGGINLNEHEQALGVKLRCWLTDKWKFREH